MFRRILLLCFAVKRIGIKKSLLVPMQDPEREGGKRKRRSSPPRREEEGGKRMMAEQVRQHQLGQGEERLPREAEEGEGPELVREESPWLVQEEERGQAEEGAGVLPQEMVGAGGEAEEGMMGERVVQGEESLDPLQRMKMILLLPSQGGPRRNFKRLERELLSSVTEPLREASSHPPPSKSVGEEWEGYEVVAADMRGLKVEAERLYGLMFGGKFRKEPPNAPKGTVVFKRPREQKNFSRAYDGTRERSLGLSRWKLRWSHWPFSCRGVDPFSVHGRFQKGWSTFLREHFPPIVMVMLGCFPTYTKDGGRSRYKECWRFLYDRFPWFLPREVSRRPYFEERPACLRWVPLRGKR